MSQVSSKINRILVGRVASNKMDKTISVLIERRVKHPKYGKYLKRSSKILAHDPENQCHEGDRVMIQEGRPLSKRKAWRLVKIVEKMLTQQAVSTETLE